MVIDTSNENSIVQEFSACNITASKNETNMSKSRIINSSKVEKREKSSAKIDVNCFVDSVI